MPSVLFVCTANVCRSPMASALFRNIVPAEDRIQDWAIESAGTRAVAGASAAYHSQLAIKNRGLDLEYHRSQPVNAQLLNGFDLILTMEQGHKESLCIEFHEVASRVYLITEMVGISHDIWDPVGGSLKEFEAMANELEQILTHGFEKIRYLAVEGSSNKV